MSLTSVGLNHQTAPVSIREKLAFAAQVLPQAVQSLADEAQINEALILSTCNRTEIYAVGEADAVVDWLARFHQIPTQEILPYLYIQNDAQTVRHAFRVSCGLDSMVLGEPQILGQLKDAVRVAQESGTLDSTLNMLFQRTLAVAKDVRTHTAVGEQSVSMAAASVKLAEQIFPNIEDLNVLFIGAGEMIELVATYFAARAPRRMTVANRTLARAQELSTKLGSNADAALLSALPDIMHAYDVVVSSTASQLPIVGKGVIEAALKRRRNKPMFLLDLAVPRDIEPQVSDLSDAFLYTVDDMTDIVNTGKESRQKAAAQAESMIEERVVDFLEWQKSRETVPLIRHLRDDGERARRYVLANALRRLAGGMPPEEVLERLSVQLTNKLLHAPTKALNQGQAPDRELVDAVARIYHLDQADSDESI
ncbi:MAG: glutamyl-tRNA reductase [Neisseria sp.]|nr:glutamyl-tRNA reductase [Neisseria sp.]